MAVGVVFNSESPPQPAHFYVPAEKAVRLQLLRNSPVRSTCTYVEPVKEESPPQLAARLADLDKIYLGSGVALLVDLTVSFLRGVAQFLSGLATLDTLVVVVVPAVEDVSVWAAIRDAPWGKCRLALRVDAPLSVGFLARYKTLNYDAIVVSSAMDVSELLGKRNPPDVLIHEEHALKEVLDLLKCMVASAKIAIHSDKLIEPLQPLTAQLDLQVYETFETDANKYAQYDAAIEMAISDLKLKMASARVLVIGPGRGPLLRAAIEHTLPNDTIVAVEKNPRCLDGLRKLAEKHANVEVLHADIREMDVSAQFDLVVSELLGSFGCNEACPEILRQFASSELVLIPLEYSSFVQPIYTDIVEVTTGQEVAAGQKVTTGQEVTTGQKVTTGQQITAGELGRPYLAHLNSFVPVGDIKPVFTFSHPGPNQLNQEFTFEFTTNEHDVANALYGYFEAQLYGPYRISILPESNPHHFCLSWYPMLFPLGRVVSGTQINMKRQSNTKLWYEWKVGDKTFNAGGNAYSIEL